MGEFVHRYAKGAQTTGGDGIEPTVALQRILDEGVSRHLVSGGRHRQSANDAL
jgi:hypothetical protein